MGEYMNNMNLYENVPKDISPVRFHLYDAMLKPEFRLHWHEHLEIHYIIEGTSVVRCEKDIVEVKSDDCLIINSNELHEGIGGICRYACIMLPPSFLEKNNVIFKKIIKDSYISEIIKLMISEYSSRDELSGVALKGYAYLVLTHLYRNYIFKEINETTYKAYSQKIIMLNEVIKYIHDNYNKDISLDDMADKIHISKYHFCHVFKEFTGQTLKEYINSIRVNKALELFSTTDIPITDIAFLCGFNDSNYFSRKFKQIIGKTPSSVRRSEYK